MSKKSRPQSFLALYFLTGFSSGALGLALLYLLGRVDDTAMLPWTWLTCFVLILSGYYANRWAFGRAPKVFYGVLFGGMAARVLVVVVIVVWVNQTGRFPMVPFLILLTVYYFLFQSIEIMIIRRQLTDLTAGDSGRSRVGP